MLLYLDASLTMDRFLLARLHMEALKAQHLLALARRKLNELPGDIFGTYDDAMERIARQAQNRQEQARKTLSWIFYAGRPLRIEELQHALAVSLGDETVDVDMIPLETDISGFCCGLVNVDRRTDVVQLVHYTARNYFDNNRSHLIQAFDSKIVLT